MFVTRRLYSGLLIAVCLSVLTAGTLTAQQDTRPTLTFGSLLDPSTSRTTEDLLEQIERQIDELLRRDYKVLFPERVSRSSDWTADGIRHELDDLLADPQVDMLLVVGPYSTAALCCIDPLQKPVFAPLGVDADALGLPTDGDSSGVHNLNYLSSPGASFRDLEKFREIVGFDTVHVVSDPLIYQVLTRLYERNQRLFAPLGIDTVPVFAVSSADEVLEQIPRDAQAVYFTPLLRMNPTELQRLIDGLNERRLPTMSLLGRAEVQLGMLAGLRAPTDYPRMARRIALNIQQTLFGKDPSTFSITFERTDRLLINMDTARKIGLYPTWRVLTDAELLHEDIPTANRLSLSDAVLTALQANRQVLAARRVVDAGIQTVREVRSSYRPQIEARTEASSINDELAFFRAPRSWSAAANLSQLIWSDSLGTAIRVEKDTQRSREQQLVQTELDVAADAAGAFLNVLRAENLERIERDNLRRVETNLELARNRVKIGYASPGEVFRWEVERADGKNKVLIAGRTLDTARVRVNQLMYRPQEEPFVTEQPDIEGDPYLAVGGEELAPFYDNPWSFRVFRNFMVEDGLANSPELGRLDAAIRARQRLVGQAKRAYWSPTIGFEADYLGVLDQSAERSAAGFQFPDEQWSVGVAVKLPLYTGGGRRAVELRRNQELIGLERERENLSDQIELRVRSAMFAISASWTNISLSREAADASRKNLGLITDSYAKGVVSIQDLLDAQNSAVRTELNASNAVYNFLRDLVEVQRAAGRLEWFKSEENRDAWIERIRDYFAKVRRSGEDPGGFE
jgi:outer membrane protein TolC